MSTYTIMDVKTQNSVSGQMWVEDPRIEAGMNGGCQTIANSNMSSHDTLLSLFPKGKRTVSITLRMQIHFALQNSPHTRATSGWIPTLPYCQNEWAVLCKP